MTKYCGNVKCRTSTSPLWRKGWPTENGNVILCNKCGLLYRKQHYCFYCYQIYRENEINASVHEKWLTCQRCNRAVHENCEKRAGYLIEPNSKYFCPDCRKLKEQYGEASIHFQEGFKKPPKLQKKRKQNDWSGKPNVKMRKLMHHPTALYKVMPLPTVPLPGTHIGIQAPMMTMSAPPIPLHMMQTFISNPYLYRVPSPLVGFPTNVQPKNIDVPQQQHTMMINIRHTINILPQKLEEKSEKKEIPKQNEVVHTSDSEDLSDSEVSFKDEVKEFYAKHFGRLNVSALKKLSALCAVCEVLKQKV
jgi:hypothetical protein